MQRLRLVLVVVLLSSCGFGGSILDPDVTLAETVFDKQDPRDLQATILWGSASQIAAITHGDVVLGPDDYQVLGNLLMLRTAFLAQRNVGALHLTVSFDQGAAVVLTVEIIDSYQPFAGGEGTAQSPYRVATAEHLHNVRYHLEAYFLQVAAIDLDGQDWEPLGRLGQPFSGQYDGGGHLIENLSVARGQDIADHENVGLFGVVASGGVVQGVTLTNVQIVGWHNTGALIGWLQGSVLDSHASGSVAGSSDNTGGLVGRNDGAIGRSSATTAVVGLTNVGGLVGENTGTIEQSFVESLELTGGTLVGGLIGSNYGGSVTDCYAHASIIGDSFVGGLIGLNSRTGAVVRRTYATGPNVGIGLLGGYDYGETTDSFFDTGGPAHGGQAKDSMGMKQLETYLNWDFGDIWAMNPAKSQGYPFLRWQGGEHAPPWSESFTGSFPPAGWNAFSYAEGQWRRGSDNTSVEHIWTNSNSDSWLVTPPLVVEAGDVLKLRTKGVFVTWYHYHGVWISTGSGDPGNNDFVELAELGPRTMDWEVVTVDLSWYAGSTVQLAFVYRGDFADNWIIDAVLVTQP